MKPKTASGTQFAFSSRIRPSAFYEATMRWGCSAISVYNHFYMPSAFESLEADYNHLTTGVTLWDVAGERQTQIKGPDAAKFVQRLTPRDLSACTAGKCRYILMTNKDGGVINDPVLLRVEEDTYWLSAADSDIHLWCQGIALNSDDDVEVTTPDISPLQLQGPRAAEVAEVVFGDWVREMKYFHLRRFELDGIPLVISRTGWSGEFGYEIYLCNGEYGDALWERIMEAGKPLRYSPRRAQRDSPHRGRAHFLTVRTPTRKTRPIISTWSASSTWTAALTSSARRRCAKCRRKASAAAWSASS